MRRFRGLYRARPRSDRSAAQIQESRMTDIAPRKPRPGLGRGLSALLGDSVAETPVSGTPEASSGIRMLPVSSMTPHPGQPRRHFDEAALQDLAESIAVRGLIQPIVVRPHGKDYQI